MKNIKLIFTMFVLFFSTITFAQNNSNIVVIVNKADWCSICKVNGQRAMEAFMSNNTDNSFKLVINDVTNKETKKVSDVELTKLGYSKIIKNHNGTGIFYFFDTKTKKILAQISVANTNEEIKMTMDKLKN
jgi:hypothetical protein